MLGEVSFLSSSAAASHLVYGLTGEIIMGFLPARIPARKPPCHAPSDTEAPSFTSGRPCGASRRT